MNDLTVILLDRPRNQSYIKAVRAAGARIRLIRDGDIAASIATARSDTSIDLLIGIGGSPEAVLSAAALKCMGGEIQCSLWPRNEEETAAARDAGMDLEKVISTDDLVGSDNVFFAATGVTTGEYLRGVDFSADVAVTHSVIMRSKIGLVLGLAVGAYMNTANEFAVMAACIGIGLAGALAGLAAERSTGRLLPIAVGAVVGALAWWYVGRAGQPETAALVGAVLGAVAGAVVGLIKRPLRPTGR